MMPAAVLSGVFLGKKSYSLTLKWSSVFFDGARALGAGLYASGGGPQPRAPPISVVRLPYRTGREKMDRCEAKLPVRLTVIGFLVASRPAQGGTPACATARRRLSA